MPAHKLFKFISLFFYSLVFIMALPAQAGDKALLRLATTTSTENSGLLQHLLPAFERDTGIRVHTIAAGTGKALRMGRDGDVDVVLVHAPAAEQAFVEAGYGIERHDVMYNDFILVGPAADPASVKQSQSASDALARIANNACIFISRGDDSGTNKKELKLWSNAAIKPKGNWYREAGQGMGKVLQMAGELSSYTLTDRGTWLAYRSKSPLQLVYQGDPALFNPYGIIAVNPARFPDINHAGAQTLINWITSPPGQRLIGNYTIGGTQSFTPSANSGQFALGREPASQAH
jgi:tungstate transport system substrate-binding protein